MSSLLLSVVIVFSICRSRGGVLRSFLNVFSSFDSKWFPQVVLVNESGRSESKFSLLLSYILYNFTWENLSLGQVTFVR